MDHDNNKAAFEKAADGLKGDVALAGFTSIQDSVVRQRYEVVVEQLVEELRRDVQSKELTWAQAAKRAGDARNEILEIMRGRSSPIGRAIAEAMKARGKTFNELIGRYTVKLFGDSARFDVLTAIQKNEVYAEIVSAAGRANPAVSARVLRWSHFGRGLLFLSFAVSVYNVFTADDTADALAKEVAVTGAGIGGGMAAGMMAGLACGPGAPVCVTLGAFIGGALAAAGADSYFR